MTLGGGVEFKGLFWDTVSTRLEYRYTDLDAVSAAGYDEFDNYYKASVDQDVQGIYLTLNYRFGEGL